MSELRLEIEGAHLVRPNDVQVTAIAHSAAQPGAVLPEPESHFVKWLVGRTSDEIEHQRAERIRSNRELTSRPGWTLDLAVIADGAPVGLQSLSGFEQWPQRRIVGTTSWLLAPFQRRGLGTRCRAAVLELAFAHLDAEAAKSWALQENVASNAVSARLGYRRIDRHTIVEDGHEYLEVVWELSREHWLASPVRSALMPGVSGVGPLRALLVGP